MRKLFIGAAIAATAAALTLVPAAADDSTPTAAGATLTGKMVSWQYLVGSWNCTVKIAAMTGQPATTDTGVADYAVVPGNALHAHISAKDYAADYYVGYVDQANRYWMNTADAYGNLSGETSADGRVFAGSNMSGETKMPIRDTLSRPTPNTTRDFQESQTKGEWHTAYDTTCRRL